MSSPACSKCKAEAVTYVRTSGQHLCKEHFLHAFERRAKMTVHEQGKLPKGTIGVALSGGKDSISLLHFLHKLTRDRPDVELVAISVDEGIAGYRESALDICRDFTTERGIPWHLITTEELAGYTIDDYASGAKGPVGDGAAKLRVAPPGEGGDRPACGPCGVFRRVGINRVAKDLGCVAVATGHNLDDTAQTILMNVLGGDVPRLARLAPHDSAQEGLVPRIIPFRGIPEKDVLLYALLEGLPLHHEAECPYAERAQRFFLRDKLWELEDRAPGTRHRLLKFQDTVKPLLVQGLEATPVKACATCGEAMSGESCQVCAWHA